MPEKKSENKAAKTSAHHHVADDLRRVYEHLGRIDILEGALAGVPFRQVSSLAALAEQQLVSGNPRDAADLLRIAEHICFAALAPEHSLANPPVSAELRAAIIDEMAKLAERAEDYWSEVDAPNETIASIYAATLEQSRKSFTSGVYRPALELARAVEALAEIAKRIPAELPDASPVRLAS
ncbi:MAG TPA: hypothetical protein VF865_01115 [Acidobacteriaceae bacterium]